MTKGRDGVGIRQKGFSLVELMVVLVIIGVLAAIAIPNMLDAKTRAQQRATVAELRNWGNGLGAYMAEIGTVPPAAGGGPVLANTIHSDLVPYAVSALHDVDAWKHDLQYFASNSAAGTNYTVASGGRDGILAPGWAECMTPATWFIYNYDLAISDGIFICAPS